MFVISSVIGLKIKRTCESVEYRLLLEHDAASTWPFVKEDVDGVTCGKHGTPVADPFGG